MKKLTLVIGMTLFFAAILRGQDGDNVQLRAYIFLSDECPMCQSYAPVLNQLKADFDKKGVEIIGVFPNYYASDSSMQAFQKEFKTTFKTQLDVGFKHTDRLKASITPQVFLENTAGVVLYAGQIDNAYFRAGKRRGTTSDNYLREAITAILNNQKPKVETTKAIGCVIVRE